MDDSIDSTRASLGLVPEHLLGGLLLLCIDFLIIVMLFICDPKLLILGMLIPRKYISRAGNKFPGTR